MKVLLPEVVAAIIAHQPTMTAFMRKCRQISETVRPDVGKNIKETDLTHFIDVAYKAAEKMKGCGDITTSLGHISEGRFFGQDKRILEHTLSTSKLSEANSDGSLEVYRPYLQEAAITVDSWLSKPRRQQKLQVDAPQMAQAA